MDAKKPTDYNRNEWELQEFFFFCVAVAGKKSDQTALKVQALSEHIREMFVENPFYEKVKPETGIIHYLLGEEDEGNAGIELLKEFKFGKYRQWKKFIKWFQDLKWYGLDFEKRTIGDWLRNADIEKLEWIPSVGKKTSRFFKLHTDPKATCIPLDTHILKFIRSHFRSEEAMIKRLGEVVPKTTPQSPYTYQFFENRAGEFMQAFMKRNYLKTLAEADLAIWKSYAYK